MLEKIYIKMAFYFFKKKILNNSPKFTENLEKQFASSNYFSIKDFDFYREKNYFKLNFRYGGRGLSYTHYLFTIGFQENDLQQLINNWNIFITTIDIETFDLMRKTECGFDYSSIENKRSILEKLNEHKKDLQTGLKLIKKQETREKEKEIRLKFLTKNLFRE